MFLFHLAPFEVVPNGRAARRYGHGDPGLMWLPSTAHHQCACFGVVPPTFILQRLEGVDARAELAWSGETAVNRVACVPRGLVKPIKPGHCPCRRSPPASSPASGDVPPPPSTRLCRWLLRETPHRWHAYSVQQEAWHADAVSRYVTARYDAMRRGARGWSRLCIRGLGSRVLDQRSLFTWLGAGSHLRSTNALARARKGEEG